MWVTRPYTLLLCSLMVMHVVGLTVHSHPMCTTLHGSHRGQTCHCFQQRITSGHRFTTCPLLSCGPGKKQDWDWDKWIGVDHRKGKIIISEHRLGVSLFWQVCSSRDLNLWVRLGSCCSMLSSWSNVQASIESWCDFPRILGIDPWRLEITWSFTGYQLQRVYVLGWFPWLEKLYQYTQNGEGVFSIGRGMPLMTGK